MPHRQLRNNAKVRLQRAPIVSVRENMPKATTKRAARPPDRKRRAVSPAGAAHRAGSLRRAKSGAGYRDELQRLAPYEGLARIVIGRRQALSLTQQELADRVGTSHSVISRIESGQHPTSVTTLRRLAAAFETHLVVGFSDKPEEMVDQELVAVS
jgi:ribosome-binding protein aMBF1 (putative translation factor)